jgi:hypothetical protein
VAEYNVNEELILMWAKRFENLALWKAIAHFQPLADQLQKEAIKHCSLVVVGKADVVCF